MTAELTAPRADTDWPPGHRPMREGTPAAYPLVRVLRCEPPGDWPRHVGIGTSRPFSDGGTGPVRNVFPI